MRFRSVFPYTAPMKLSTLYQSRLLELNRTPLNHGSLDAATHSARGQDALCGDDLVIELALDEGGTIINAMWHGQACAITSASASLLTEWIVDRNVGAVQAGFHQFEQMLTDPGVAITDDLGEISMLAAVAHYPSRVKNALLPWKTTLDALTAAVDSAV